MINTKILVLALVALVIIVASAYLISAKIIGGKGALYAKGVGTAVLKGSGKIAVRGTGVITVENYSPNRVRVWMKGHGTRILRGNTLICRGSGEIIVEGSNIIVHIRTLTPSSEVLAYGKGWIVLEGEGVFRTWKD